MERSTRREMECGIGGGGLVKGMERDEKQKAWGWGRTEMERDTGV